MPIALNMTPMIDVVFLLLVYFVLTAQFGAQGHVLAMEVRAADSGARDPFALPRKPIRLSLVSDSDLPGDYTLISDHPGIDRAMDIGRMVSSLLDKPGIARDHPVSIEPSNGAIWEHALAAYADLQHAGFTNTSLSAGAP
jgi:biopolymer transport protein ExbD